jgi:hypothetical protein
MAQAPPGLGADWWRPRVESADPQARSRWLNLALFGPHAMFELGPECVSKLKSPNHSGFIGDALVARSGAARRPSRCGAAVASMMASIVSPSEDSHGSGQAVETERQHRGNGGQTGESSKTRLLIAHRICAARHKFALPSGRRLCSLWLRDLSLIISAPAPSSAREGTLPRR